MGGLNSFTQTNKKTFSLMTYKLTVTKHEKGAAKFTYTVTDENGTVLSTRRSNRVYVACTIYGNYYFGRLDLIGKGDHGKALKSNQAGPDHVLNQIAYA